MLQRVGDRAVSSAKVVYEVLASPFEDGTEMTVADLLYPFAFAYRWGAKAGRGGDAHEPRLEAVLAALQERLVGAQGRARGQDNACHRRGPEPHRENAGAGGLSQGRPGRRAAARGAGSAVEHGALASAGADGGGGDPRTTPPSRRRRPPGGGFPGWTWCAIRR